MTADLQAGIARKLGLRPHPNGQHNQIGVELRPRLRTNHQCAALRLFKARDPVTQHKPHSTGDQVLARIIGHLRIKRRHNLMRKFDDGHIHPAVRQVFGHLQTDEPAADNHGLLRMPRIDPFADPAAVGDGAQSKDARQVRARPARTDRRSPRRQHQLIVGFVVLAPGNVIANRKGARFAVNGDGLMPRAHLDVEPLLEQRGRGQQQLGLVVDHIAHIVGQAAVCKRDVGPAIEKQNLRFLIKAPQARRACRSAGYAAHNHYTFIRHISPLFEICISSTPVARLKSSTVLSLEARHRKCAPGEPVIEISIQYLVNRSAEKRNYLDAGSDDPELQLRRDRPANQQIHPVAPQLGGAG